MYYIAVCLYLAVSTLAAPAPTEVVPLEKQQPTVIPIVSQSEELEPNGTYKFSYETGNGIKREEISYDKVNPKALGRSADSNEGEESDESGDIHVQIGSYSYTAPDGTLISVRYIADENGFQPVGDHIPSVGHPFAGNFARESKSLKKVDSASSESVPVLLSSKAKNSEVAPESPKDAVEGSESGASAESSTTGTAAPDIAAEKTNTKAAPEALTPEAPTTEVAKSETSSALSSNAVRGSESTSEAASTTTAAIEGSGTASEANPESPTTEAQSTTAAAPAAAV